MKKALIGTVIGVGGAALLLYFSKSAAQGIRDGLGVCASTVVPSLFPFMIFSCFLSRSYLSHAVSRMLSPITRRVFRLPASLGAVVLMSFAGGYPVGAKLIAAALKKGDISPATAKRMLIFCVNAGPSFIISAVGVGMFNNMQAGILLLAAHAGASILLGIFTRPREKVIESKGFEAPRYESGIQAFVGAVIDASDSILKMCGFILAFSAIARILRDTGAMGTLCSSLASLVPFDAAWGKPEFFSALFHGILEVTAGCLRAVACGGFPSLLLAAFLVSFSGLSVLFQAASFFNGLEFHFPSLLLAKLAHGLLTVLLLLPFRHSLDTVVCVAAQQLPPTAYYTKTSLLMTICLLAICGILLLSINCNIVSNKKR